MRRNYLTHAGLIICLCLIAALDKGCCCGLGWLNYGDHCFRFYPLNLTRHVARLRCIIEGSDLASISNVTILDFIAQHAAHADGEKFWVGLDADMPGGPGTTPELVWLDGTTNAEKEHWVKMPDPNEYPPTSINYRTWCFAYNRALVVKVPCYQRMGMICGHTVASFRNNSRCQANMDSFVGEVTGNCFFRASGLSTRDTVEEACRTHGGHFVNADEMIKDGLSAFYDNKVLINDGSKYWTSWTWDGTKLYWNVDNGLPEEMEIPVIAACDCGENAIGCTFDQNGKTCKCEEKYTDKNGKCEGNGSCITVQFNFTDSSAVTHSHFYQTDCSERARVVCAKDEPSLTTTPRSVEDKPLMDSRPVTCPEGYNWKSDKSDTFCYWETSYETEHLSWDDAELYCQGYGGHLASFHSVDEERIGLSFQYGSLAHPYWIGLSLDIETGTYKWSDGTPLVYTNWAPGHPNHRDKRLRCVAMEANEKHWVSSLCGILSWFVCKVPKQARHYAPVRPSPTPLQPCDSASKRMTEVSIRADGLRGAFRFQSACYIAVNEAYSWHRAKLYCENEGASLVSIHSGEEVGFLLKLLHDATMETNRVWIGLNSFGSDDSFHWTDWSPVDFTFFTDKEPNNYQNQEKCCNMFTRNGQWNDENCNAPLGFICKWSNESASSTMIPSTPDPRVGNCKKGWMAQDDRCYYFGGSKLNDRVNWTTASNICQREGGYLASIRNEKDQAFLSYMLQSLKADAWIGLHDTIQSGRYYWLDNSELSYTNWAPGEPSFFGITEDCVKMVYDHQDSGVWKDEDCDRTFGYICQNKRDPDLPKPSVEISTNCLQPEGWLKLERMCLKMFGGNILTWEEAEAACQKDGGHLVSVSDQKVKAAVSYLATEVNQPFFIGLKYKKDTQKISWLNGYPVSLTNWEKNEPSSLEDSTCFASTSEGYWRKSPCDEQMPFLCQITTGKRPKPRQYTGSCPPTSKYWTPGSGSFCYSLETDHHYDWFTANLMCFRHGTHLVSIHSMKEIEDLKKFMAAKVTSVFIGLMRNKKGGFTWTDETPVDFENWDEGEPSNTEDQCVEMVASTMKWRVTNCIAKRWFICLDHKDTLINDDDPQNAGYMDDFLFFPAGKSGLSAAAICAVVFSVLVLVVIVAAAVFYRQKYSKLSPFQRHTPDHTVSFENALYKVGSADMEFIQDVDRRRISA